ncbi:VWFA domain-containing protein [Planctomycetales bacterium 10988]|nr:VWFA domain-containing protein [Planctomycetales bacterium 10988]
MFFRLSSLMKNFSYFHGIFSSEGTSVAGDLALLPEEEALLEEWTCSPWQRLEEISGLADLRTMQGFLFSISLHLLVIGCFAGVTWKITQEQQLNEFTWLTEEEEEITPPEPELDLAFPDDEPKDSLLESLAGSVALVQDDLAEIIEEPQTFNAEVAELEVFTMDEPLVAALTDPVLVNEGTVGQAVVHVDGAMDRITFEIMSRLERGPVFVIWLLDASISQVEERGRVRERLQQVYDELDQLKERNNGGLMSAVLGYGQIPQEVMPPTTNGEEVLAGIDAIQVDESGIENVFSTILWSVQKYRPIQTRDRRQTMVVVWTDESGSDLGRLEETVNLCVRQRIPVFAVGPSAMFGQQLGYRSYKHPENGEIYQLPLDRGPDSPFQERLGLPYWFEGPQLETLHSGIGPYALSRLCVESGGSYFINDQEEDRSPFAFESMQPYMPEYISAKEYLYKAQQSPLRRAVMRVVKVTNEMNFKETPTLQFAPTGANYQQQLIEAQKTVAYNMRTLETALQAMGAKGFEKEYAEEPSPRWRAWYDLTRGRLLAMYVRNMEYNWACAVMKGLGPNFVDQESNRWNFVPHPEMKMGSSTEKFATEAKMLLERCVEQNPGTPWAHMAERELKDPFGFKVEESYVAPPPEPEREPGNNNPPPPPNRERRTEELRMLEREKPVVLPKL